MTKPFIRPVVLDPNLIHPHVVPSRLPFTMPPIFHDTRNTHYRPFHWMVAGDLEAPHCELFFGGECNALRFGQTIPNQWRDQYHPIINEEGVLFMEPEITFETHGYEWRDDVDGHAEDLARLYSVEVILQYGRYSPLLITLDEAIEAASRGKPVTVIIVDDKTDGKALYEPEMDMSGWGESPTTEVNLLVKQVNRARANHLKRLRRFPNATILENQTDAQIEAYIRGVCRRIREGRIYA